MEKSYYRVISVLSILLLCACGQIGNDSTASSNSGSSSSSSTAAENIPKSQSEALGSSFSAEQTVSINLTNLTSTVDGSDDALITTTKNKYFYDGEGNATVKVDLIKYNGTSNGVIRVDITDVTKPTAVHISGSNDAVKGIKIQTSKSYQNGVILDGVTINSGNFPCVEMTKKGSVNVQLIGTNILTDGRTFGIGYGEEYSTTSGATYEDEDGNTVSCTIVQNAEANGSDAKGTLYARGDMTIYGNGTLNVTQHYKNCIASKMILTVEQGTYILTSDGKAGLYGDYAVYMKDGSVTFNGTGEVSSTSLRKSNGIKTDDDTYIDSFVSVNGGILNVTTAYGKGISSPVVNLAGGTNTIKVNSPTTKQLNISSSYVTADGMSKSATESFAPQGISGDTVNLTGGSWTINAPWSGIDCDGNMSVSGGTVNITTTANGLLDSSENDYDAPSCVKVSGNMNVTNGTITGSNSGNGGKGIKVGGTYTQSNGNINLTVTGSNLGSSSSQGGMGGPQQQSSSSSPSASAKGMRVAGAMNISGGKLYVTANSHEAIETKSTLTISGGEVYGYSSDDDAINSAGDMTISGGYVCAWSDGNDGLDANGNCYIKGGVVFAVCSSQPEVAIDANTEQQKCLYIQGGTIMTVGPLEGGASLSQSCYQSSSWSANTWYGLTVGSTTYVFKTPTTTSGYGSGIVVSGASTPTLTSGASTGGTSYFNGRMYQGGTAGSSVVSISNYTPASQGGGGPRR